jgi:MoxR-like ATPase
VLEPAVTVEEVRELQEALVEVYVDDLIQRWIIDLVRATRELDGISVGASVRGSLALERVSRAWALVDGRDYVVPEDVESLFNAVLAHRIAFSPAFMAQARRTGWPEALAALRVRCLEVAPRPEARRGPGQDTASPG